MGFPVLTTGYVLAPRGVGTMIAMVLVGRLIGKRDTRALILLGIGLTALSLWEISGFTTEVPISTIVWTGIPQRLGLGFIFVPLRERKSVVSGKRGVSMGMSRRTPTH